MALTRESLDRGRGASELEASSSPADAYARDGFYVHDQPIIPADLMARASAGMAAIRAGNYDTGQPPAASAWNPGDDPRRLCKIELPQRASLAVRELVSDRRLGSWAALLTRAERVQVWWVQMLHKPPSDSAGPTANVGWHQDRQYWDPAWEEGSELLTAWVALSDVTLDAGPMLLIRGSHRWGDLTGGDFFAQDREAQSGAVQAARPAGAAWEEVPAVLPPGGVSFHGSRAVHGSGPNRSVSPRVSLAIHLRTQRSAPRGGKRVGLTAFLDDPEVCPVIHGR